MAASETALGKLHSKLAEVMSEALDGEELPGYYDDESGEAIPGKRLLPSASVMTVVAKFLKDNEITAVAEEDTEMGDLMKKLEDRQKALRLSKTDRSAILADTSFVGGNA